MDHCVNLGCILWSLCDGSASPGQHQLHQSRRCELGVCYLKNPTKPRANTGFVVPSTCPIHCLVQLLQCPIPLSISVPAPLLTLLLFAFAPSYSVHNRIINTTCQCWALEFIEINGGGRQRDTSQSCCFKWSANWKAVSISNASHVFPNCRY